GMPDRPRSLLGTFRANAYLTALLFVALAGGTAALLRRFLALPDPNMVFLTAVLCTAVVAGLGPSILASLVSVAVYDFFFVDPVHAFTGTKPQDLVSL